MNEGEMNPRLKKMMEGHQEQRGSEKFEFEWSGTRVPTNITFPNGTEKTVQYMRDGILMFQDGSSATYERIIDDLKQPKQKIEITFAQE